MQEKVCQHRINDADELRERILSAWDELDQRVIDMAVRQAVVNLLTLYFTLWGISL